MIQEINGIKYIVHYRWVYPWGNYSACGEPVISYLERIEEEDNEKEFVRTY